MPLEGQHLGHYHLQRLLGSGGMGEVYLAEDARIGQQVAIKVVRSEGIAYPQSESAIEAARLFEREAKAIARLDHPNILPLYAYGEETLNDNVMTYLVMPYRKEGTLATWLRQRGGAAPLSSAEVAPLLHQAANALQHAHDQHVLHQDIKPSNFLIRLRSEQPKQPDLLLSDFGIAKLTSATAGASQSIRGTPNYMAPEQWNGHPVPASDQYALAIMVYELLVGRPPFVGNPAQVMRQHYLTSPPAPSSLHASLSPAIDAVLLRALCKQPEERFASVNAFARAFHEAMQNDGALRATLAISQTEAASGTTRSLTLPGRRQVSVTVPAGIKDGSILSLEGQGMPYYEGGPTGPLVLMIAISSEEGSQPLTQESMDPTVAMSLPNTKLTSIEDPSIPPAHHEAPGLLEPTVPATHESDTASTVLATDATSLPTEAANPASQPELVQLQQVAAILPVPKAGASWKGRILITLVGITIFGIAVYLSDLVYLNIYNSNSPLTNPIIPSWYSQSWLVLIVGWTLVVPFFFGARFGPWVGLCTAVIGSLLGDVISGYLATNSVGWYWYIAIAACGFFPGLAYLRSRGRNLSIRAALLFSLLGMIIYFITGTIGDSISNNQWIWGNFYQYAIPFLFQTVITSMLASLTALLLLLITLSVSNALGKNHIPSY
jgi:serine/threonine protein kinase